VKAKSYARDEVAGNESLSRTQNTSNNSYCILAFEMARMVAKSQTNPRKLASQQRSHLTMDALLGALLAF
jgi:hypothetical protein